jgi:hypothetical protein
MFEHIVGGLVGGLTAGTLLCIMFAVVVYAYVFTPYVKMLELAFRLAL